MARSGDRVTLPNLISGLRLVTAPCLIGAAAAQARSLFIVLLGAAVVSDAVDGLLARAWGQCTAFGARLDSAADVALLFSALSAMLLLYPALRTTELPTTIAIALAYIIPIAAGVIRFGRLTSYHTLLAKTAAAVLAAGAVVWIASQSAWLLRIAAVVLLVSAAEELTITVVLPEWSTDVASVFRAWRRTAGPSD